MHFVILILVWVRADSIEDLAGPLFITHPSDPPISFTVDEDDRFLAYPLPGLYDSPESPPEPTIMQQVFIGSRIIGSSDGFSFKSCNGKYISSDKFGVVTCQSEAIGGQEEWKPVLTDAGIAFENVYKKYLMIDEVAGGGVRIRADADDVGYCETFRVYCQARFKYKPKTKKKDKGENIGSEIGKKFQSYGRNIIRSESDKRDLKKARTEGRLAEALLDKREKAKSDRYCK
ncbi:FRG1-like family-domain-containing protein [Mycotypha africana]|uniref:FRG1-like family-domain-containing protein n=1 Tax=Mycotypha africana TaxID=64632 RepID=UPI002301FA6C|nr:FRG1-like family-domain-containing protein [Mycotypha africana]KAI8984151.1 FRG1-like family-domain-containing protein [Mycotypha africana]